VTKNGYLVAVLGDPNLKTGSRKYLLAENLGQNLIDNGYQLVIGTLDGISEAVSSGARHSSHYSEGDIISILLKKNPEPVIETGISTYMDLKRNVVVSTADAVIAIGGGAATVLDIANAWTLNRLIIAFRVDGVSGKTADKKVTPRNRYPGIPSDRVYGVNSTYEAIECLNQKIGLYASRHSPV
jgi:uncharacterized protein (TIGR00725 family)